MCHLRVTISLILLGIIACCSSCSNQNHKIKSQELLYNASYIAQDNGVRATRSPYTIPVELLKGDEQGCALFLSSFDSLLQGSLKEENLQRLLEKHKTIYVFTVGSTFIERSAQIGPKVIKYNTDKFSQDEQFSGAINGIPKANY